MADFLDTFTDTANLTLVSHTADSGEAWTLRTGNAGALRISDANRVRTATAGEATVSTTVYTVGWTPPAADYWVQFVVRKLADTPADSQNGACYRYSNTTNHYYCRYDDLNERWELNKIVAGSSTSLGTFSEALTLNTDYVCRVELNGTGQKLYVNGVERISATDSAFALAGSIGLRMRLQGDNAGGVHLDTLQASDTFGTPASLTVTEATATAQAEAVALTGTTVGTLAVSAATATAAGQAVDLTGVVAAVLTASAATATAQSTGVALQTGPPARLPYAPPPQTSPTVVNLTTGTNQDLGPYGDTEDVLLVMPATKKTGHVHVTGGRHIRCIGGYSTISSSSLGIGFFFEEVKGSIFLEGLLFDRSGGQDGDFVQTECPDITGPLYVQNCRVEGVTGTFAGSHADIIQSRVLPGGMKVYNLTGWSNYQGLFCADHGGAVGHIEIRRTNIAIVNGPDDRYAFFMWGPMLSPPSTFDHTFALGPDFWVWKHDDDWLLGIRPNTTDDAPYTADITGDVISWPGLEALDKVTGTVTIGTPPNGDFVPAGFVGLGYESPGYFALEVSPASATAQGEAVAFTAAATLTAGAATATAQSEAVTLDAAATLSIGTAAATAQAEDVTFDAAGRMVLVAAPATAEAGAVGLNGGTSVSGTMTIAPALASAAADGTTTSAAVFAADPASAQAAADAMMRGAAAIAVAAAASVAAAAAALTGSLAVEIGFTFAAPSRSLTLAAGARTTTLVADSTTRSG